MQVNPGNAMSPDSQDQNSLEELAALIERATRDGRLSRQEWEDIRAKVREDGRITPQELDLTNQLMEQVNQGIIILED
jgi:uncharacterized membrane protein YebE (DUF533 family)